MLNRRGAHPTRTRPSLSARHAHLWIVPVSVYAGPARTPPAVRHVPSGCDVPVAQAQPCGARRAVAFGAQGVHSRTLSRLFRPGRRGSIGYAEAIA